MSLISSPQRQPRKMQENSEPRIRKYIPTGGTIVGKTTANGGYIAGALTKKEQEELVGNAINKEQKENVKIQTIGHIDAGGSQNITEKHISDLVKIIQSTPSKKDEGILVTAGTDKIAMLTHCLSLLIPNPTSPIVLTAAMCPPGGVKSGIGTYEDGPVNLRSAEHLLKTLEKTGKTQILAVMENNAYSGGNMRKSKPKGVEGAFTTRIGNPAYKLEAQSEDAKLENNSGNPKYFQWREKNPIADAPKAHKKFESYQSKVLDKMSASGGLEASIVTENGQRKASDDIKSIAEHHKIIGYKGVGNGNINEKDALPVIEQLILDGKGHSFVRGTSADATPIENQGSETGNVKIFKDIAKDKSYKLTDFMIPQDRFRTEEATQTVAMINAMGLKPPSRSGNITTENYLEDYKDYVNKATEAMQSSHPLIRTTEILGGSKN